MHVEHLIQVELDLLTRLQQLSNYIGNTPTHLVSSVFSKKGVRIFAKKEWEQISGSVKARAAYHIVRSAIERGELHRGKTLLDASSGNTGIAYAAIARALGLKVTICLPENATQERKDLLLNYGAQVVFTSKLEGTDGAQEVALDLANTHPDLYFYADQYKNCNNWLAHYSQTAPEIYQSFPQITHFVAGLGTTGTFVGTGRKLKEYNPSIQLVALQPDFALHGLEGWKHLETAKVPGIFDPNLADMTLEVSTEEAYELIRAAHKHEDLLLSPSAAANLAGAIKVAEKLDSGTVVTILPDNADKYGEIIKKLF